jgi:hypothetical protein
MWHQYAPEFILRYPKAEADKDKGSVHISSDGETKHCSFLPCQTAILSFFSSPNGLAM